MTERARTKNRLVRCPRCGNLIKAHVVSLKWIRCPECGHGVEIKPNLLPEWLLKRRL